MEMVIDVFVSAADVESLKVRIKYLEAKLDLITRKEANAAICWRRCRYKIKNLEAQLAAAQENQARHKTV